MIQNPIQLYIEVVNEYLDMEKIIAGCKTEQEWRKVCELSDLYLEPGFMNDYSDLELYEMCIIEHRNKLQNVTDDLRDKIKTWKINIEE